MKLYPLTFEEFLAAVDEGLYQYYGQITRDNSGEAIFHTKLTEVYQQYLIIGGVPECVSSWVKNEIVQKYIRFSMN